MVISLMYEVIFYWIADSLYVALLLVVVVVQARLAAAADGLLMTDDDGGGVVDGSSIDDYGAVLFVGGLLWG